MYPVTQVVTGTIRAGRDPVSGYFTGALVPAAVAAVTTMGYIRPRVNTQSQTFPVSPARIAFTLTVVADLIRAAPYATCPTIGSVIFRLYTDAIAARIARFAVTDTVPTAGFVQRHLTAYVTSAAVVIAKREHFSVPGAVNNTPAAAVFAGQIITPGTTADAVVRIGFRINEAVPAVLETGPIDAFFSRSAGTSVNTGCITGAAIVFVTL